MIDRCAPADIVMLGTFSSWRRGTLQARALPIAQDLTRRGLKVVIVTTPWDEPAEAGVCDVIGGVRLINTRATAVVHAPVAVGEMVRLTRALKPAIVHVFKPRGFGGLAGRMLEREFPIVVDCDDWEGDGGWNRIGSYPLLLRRVFDWQERSLIRRARAVTAASSLLETRALRLRPGMRNQSVVRVPNGLTESWIETISAAGNQSTTGDPAPIPTVAVYSRFEEISTNWLGQFVSALDELTCAALRVVVIGPASPRQLFLRRGSFEVNLLGYVAREQLPSILARVNLAVVPLDDSLVSRSKQSVKLLELMAAGCAVIATDVGDVAATLGDAGAVVRGSDPQLFAERTFAMIGVRDQRTMPLQMGAQRVREQFGISAIASDVMSAYRLAGAAFA